MAHSVFHSGTIASDLGGWVAPFGITAVVDPLAAIMLILATGLAFFSILYSFCEQKVEKEHPLRLPLVQFLIAGICQSFITGDLFNLFVAFEVMLIASYALMTLEQDDWDIRQAYPYFAVNFFSSCLLIALCGYVYGLVGSLSFAEIALRMGDFADDPLLTVIGLMMVVVFGVKTGLFPLYFWLPNSYPTLPPSVVALFSGLLTKVGVYVLLRMFGTVMPHDLTFVHWTIALIAAPTMFFGVIGPVSRNFVSGILAFHIVSQIGFIILAIGFFTTYAIAGAIFYVIHVSLVKATLFLLGGAITRLNGSEDLTKTGNLWVTAPFLGLCFLLSALSLAGLPPLSGFWGKFMIVVAGLGQGAYILVGISIITSLLTLFSMLKIWLGAFWKKNEKAEVNLDDPYWKNMTRVGAVLTGITLLLGLGAQPVLEACFIAAERLMDPVDYIQAVFGEIPESLSARLNQP